jgi:spore germination cell wall hydrolase CwlJ-like protein
MPVQTAHIDVATTPEFHATPASYESAAPSVGPSQEELLAQVFLQQGQCLADALYYEARGEGRAGQMAIAEVVYNRMRSGYYPRTICGIVYEGSRHSGCQFSFACSGDMARRRSPGAWQHAQRLALQIVMGLVKLGDTTNGAMSFHAATVDPSWSDTMARTVQIGHHIFYRPARRSLTRGA